MGLKESHDIDSDPIRILAIEWFKEKVTAKQEITMPIFCEEFNFLHEEEAHNAFMIPLSSTEIPCSIRTAISYKYGSWKRSEGEKYWASRLTNYTIDVATEETTGDLIKRSKSFSQVLLRELPLKLKGRSNAGAHNPPQ
ncbi:hypothetical protein BGZ76_005598, partial [Entomortierella beljakovae]